jgi:hypothetical protein
MTIRLLLAVLLIGPIVYNRASAQEPSWEEIQDLPMWAMHVLRGPQFNKDYLLSTRLNPFLVQGDFNGDGAIDIAVLITRRGDGRRGIAILHAGARQPIILGAGHAVGNGGDDFAWMGAWSVYPKGPVHQSVIEHQGPPPQLRGDALVVEKLESASGIIYWDGTAYRWYQQGD